MMSMIPTIAAYAVPKLVGETDRYKAFIQANVPA